MRLRDHTDAQSWQEFVDIYGRLIYDFCRHAGLQPSDAADVTQNVMLRVSKSIQQFEYDPDRGLFRDWLARIVLNEVRRHTSKRRKGEITSSSDLDLDSKMQRQWNEQFHQHILEVALERCRNHFSNSTWEIFQLSWMEKLPVEEVSRQLNVEIDKIYVARCRVLKQLRCEVTNLADDYL